MTLSCNFDRDLLMIDTECTGVEEHHVICQWGSILLDRHTLEEKSRFSTLVQINVGDAGRADPRAMEIHGIPMDKLMDPYYSLHQSKLAAAIHDAHGEPSNYHIYGVHVVYDVGMYKRMAKRGGYDYAFPESRPTSCRVYDLQAFWHTVGATLGKGWGNCALRQMCKKFDIQAPEKHDAVGDCEMSAEVQRRVMRMIQPPDYTAPVAPQCPKCESNMLLKQNSKTHHRFWSCSTFPACRGTRNLKK